MSRLLMGSEGALGQTGWVQWMCEGVVQTWDTYNPIACSSIFRAPPVWEGRTHRVISVGRRSVEPRAPSGAGRVMPNIE